MAGASKYMEDMLLCVRACGCNDSGGSVGGGSSSVYCLRDISTPQCVDHIDMYEVSEQFTFTVPLTQNLLL